jgi:hypothetical protein
MASPSGSSSFELVAQKMHARKTATMTGTTTKGELISISTSSLRDQDTKGATLSPSAPSGGTGFSPYIPLPKFARGALAPEAKLKRM